MTAATNGRLPPQPIAPSSAQVEVPLPGQVPLVTAALAIGILLLGVQLWLLTVTLDLFLAGHDASVGLLAATSGAIFLGGLGMLWLLRRRPRLRRPVGDEAPFAAGAWGSGSDGDAG